MTTGVYIFSHYYYIFRTLCNIQQPLQSGYNYLGAKSCQWHCTSRLIHEARTKQRHIKVCIISYHLYKKKELKKKILFLSSDIEFAPFLLIPKFLPLALCSLVMYESTHPFHLFECGRSDED